MERITKAVCRQERHPLIIEIGPGQGALTALLLDRADHVVVVEIDPLMIDHLRDRFPDHPSLTIHQGDVLKTDLAQWGPAVLAGNLPYYITSPILDCIFAARQVLTEATVLVQKEVAERMVATPGSRDYGFLSVRTQLHAEAKLMFKVPPGSFTPPPKVDSAVVHMKVRQGENQEEFLAFAGRCFGQKRKTLRNNLAPYYGKEKIEAQPESGLRAEQMSIAQLRDLMLRLA